MIDHLDPEGNAISHRLFREDCTLTNVSLYTKDLKLFCDSINRPIEKVVLVDNAAYSFAWNIDNGIPIIPYYDNR